MRFRNKKSGSKIMSRLFAQLPLSFLRNLFSAFLRSFFSTAFSRILPHYYLRNLFFFFTEAILALCLFIDLLIARTPIPISTTVANKK
jgi:hypothetical protein